LLAIGLYTLNIKLLILTKNKKILIVTECFYPEEFKINDVALSWKNKGYDIDVLTLAPTYPLGQVFQGYKNSFFRKDKYKGVNIYRIRSVTGYRSSKIKKIFKYLNFMILGSVISIFIGRKYDYILGFNMSALTGMLPAVLIRKLYKKPLTFWTQDVWPDSVYAYGFKKTKMLSTVLDIFVRFMYRNIDSIAVSGKGFESKLTPYVRKDLIFHYLPNWADDLDKNLTSKNLGKSKEATHFTFAGNIGKVQNLENIINAFCLLSSEYQEKSQFNIIGDGSNLDNLKLLSNNNPNIVFHGKKPRSDMASYYKASDFLIISLIDKPIFSVTVPAKTQTYIAAKKPILAIINGDTASIIQDNNLGLCADPSKIDDIAAIFQRCIDMGQTEIHSFTNENDRLLATIFNKEKTIGELLKLVTG
jgi:glycosyltransferase involved in cell wall biosynthesis